MVKQDNPGKLIPIGWAFVSVLALASLTSCDRPNLTEARAIDLVRAYLFGQSRPTTEEQRVCKDVPRTVRKPCTQFDVDADPNKRDEFLARCRPVGGTSAARYGYKNVTTVKKECRNKTVEKQGPCPAPAEGGEWTADYGDGEWRVVVTRSSTGTNSWRVNDHSRSVASDQPPC